jgi:hypothetical protein
VTTKRQAVKKQKIQAINPCLVYGVLTRGPKDRTLVCIPEPEAIRLASIHRAVRSSKTWGDFYDRVAPSDLKELDEVWDECDRRPEREEKFDCTEVPGFCDGDWPAWPQQEMMGWLPREIWTRYAKKETSVINGYYITIDPFHERAIIKDLKRLGYLCRRNNRLVTTACGD